MSHGPALFIGRFQPFHVGHLDAVRQILAQHEKIIIGIGSAQYENLPENPFSANVRRRMIKESLVEAGIAQTRFTIVEIPDIHNDTAWVAHVETLTPKFAAVYSGTQKVQNLFQNAGYTVITPHFNIAVSGTQIREKMARGEKWEHMVPGVVAEIIKKKVWK